MMIMDAFDEVGKALKAAVIENNVDEVTKIVTDAPRFHSLSLVCDWTKGVGHFGEPTALTIAAEYGHTECARKILELGGNLYSVGRPENAYVTDAERPAFIFLSKDYFGALVIAASKGHVETIKSLTEFRLFEVSKVQDEYANFVKAANEGDFQKIQVLLELVKVEDKDAYLKGWKGHNIMNLCLLLGCTSACLQAMVDHGIGVNGWDYNGLTPLMCAIIGRNVECVRLLLDKGADPYEIHITRRMSFQDDGTVLYIDYAGRVMDYLEPDFRDDWSAFRDEFVGFTALIYAAVVGNLPILEMMLKAAPKDIPFWGRLSFNMNAHPLKVAVFYATVEAVSLIMEFEASTDKPDQELLCNAIRLGKTEMFEFLLKRLVIEKEWPYYIGLQKCVEYRNSNYLIKMLDTIQKDVFKEEYGGALFSAIEKNFPECVEPFVKRSDFSIEMKCLNGYVDPAYGLTCFMFSCKIGSENFAKKFFEIGANVNAVDIRGKTAAMHAARYDRVNILEFLLEVHADFDAVDNKGETSFSAALMGDGNSLEYLLNAGVLFDKNTLKLKTMHSASVKAACRLRGQEYTEDDFLQIIPIKNIICLIRRNIFHWDWCAVADKFSMRNILFAAVSSGVSPCKLTFNKRDISPFVYAVLTKNVNAARYLLANHYIFPEDYRFVLTDDEVRETLNSDDSSEITFLIEHLSLRLLSLKTWSVLTILESIVPGSVPGDTFDRVDTLPLPVGLKKLLKPDSEISKLCPRHWRRLGPQIGGNIDAGFEDLVVDGEVIRNPVLERCGVGYCPCGDVGLSMEKICWEDVVDDNDYDYEEGDHWS